MWRVWLCVLSWCWLFSFWWLYNADSAAFDLGVLVVILLLLGMDCAAGYCGFGVNLGVGGCVSGSVVTGFCDLVWWLLAFSVWLVRLSFWV